MSPRAEFYKNTCPICKRAKGAIARWYVKNIDRKF